MALDIAGRYAGRIMITDRSKIATSRSLNRPCNSGVASLARATSWCARCSNVNKVIQQQVPSSEAAKDLLNWLADRPGAIRTAAEVDESPSTAGRRLLASRNFAADEVLMSVPLTSVFVDIETDADTYIPWSARMALRLLQHKSLCLKAVPDDALMCPWIAALPRQVILPHIHFSDAEIMALQDPETVQEVQAMRLSHEACFQELEEDLEVVGCNRQDFDWAVSVLHSRCFIQGPQSIHMTVPGVDMANHSFSPNATVRCVYSPEASQGREAEEDVCDPPPAQPAMFQLLSGPDGVRNGEEVTISYGDWPNDVFLLFFGFLPEGNQHDSVVLFDTLQDLAHCYDLLVQQQGQQAQQQQQLQEAQHTTRQEHIQNQHLQHQHDDYCSETQDPEPQASTSDAHQQPAGHPQAQRQAHASSSHVNTDQGPSRSSQLEQSHAGASPITESDSDQSLAKGDAVHFEAAFLDLHANGMPESQSSDSGTDWTERQLALLEARLGPGDWTRLVVTAAGFDGRLIHAAQALVHLHGSNVDDEQLQSQVPSLGALLSFRCNQMLSQFVTSIQQDVQQLRSRELNDNMHLVVQYRLGKKQILQHAYDASTQDVTVAQWPAAGMSLFTQTVHL